jgi:putative Mn2+ efflux pump MntP
MDKYLNHLQGMADFERISFRFGHILILVSGLLIGAIGIYIVPAKDFILKVMQWLGSLFLLIACCLFIYSFFYELPPTEVDRPIRRMAIYFILTGIVGHLFSVLEIIVPMDEQES